MKTVLILTGLFVFFNLQVASAQRLKNSNSVVEAEQINVLGTKESAEKIQKKETISFDGTYQFVMVDDIKPLLTKDIISFVDQNRSNSEDLTLDYSENIKIFIPSINSINSENFEVLDLYGKL